MDMYSLLFNGHGSVLIGFLASSPWALGKSHLSDESQSSGVSRGLGETPLSPSHHTGESEMALAWDYEPEWGAFNTEEIAIARNEKLVDAVKLARIRAGEKPASQMWPSRVWCVAAIMRFRRLLRIRKGE